MERNNPASDSGTESRQQDSAKAQYVAKSISVTSKQFNNTVYWRSQIRVRALVGAE